MGEPYTTGLAAPSGAARLIHEMLLRRWYGMALRGNTTLVATQLAALPADDWNWLDEAAAAAEHLARLLATEWSHRYAEAHLDAHHRPAPPDQRDPPPQR